MIPFLKMHGLGNDFVVLDNRDGTLPALNWAKLADRHFGIGCDQLVVLEPSQQATVFMRIYNADGGEVESCGNASRCIAWLVGHEKHGTRSRKSIKIETLAGIIEAWVGDDMQVTIDMGSPKFDWEAIPLRQKKDTLHLNITKGVLSDPVALSMGNPHMVFFVNDVNAVPLEKHGPELEHHSFFPERANVGVAQIVAHDSIALRVWERGAGLTLACGTGACAALVAAHVRGLTGRQAAVHLPGGALQIDWRPEDDHVFMTGPVAISFDGEFSPEEYGLQ